MTTTVTMLQTRQGEGGSLWTVGNSYAASDAFATVLINSNYATGTLPKSRGLVPVNAQTDSNGQITALVDGAGNVLSFAGPAYTWVNLPAASLNAGNTVRVTDVGASAAGSLWISDGVYWRPLNGSLVLASGRAGQPGTPIAVATSFSKLSLPAGPMIVSGSLVLPVGLLRPGVGLRINSFMRHTGTAGTWGGVFRIGTANTSSDSPLAVGQGSATNDQTMWTFMDANCAANGVITTAYNMQPNAAASSGSYAARTTNIDLTQVMYLGIHVNAITAPDTIELQSYSITLVD